MTRETNQQKNLRKFSFEDWRKKVIVIGIGIFFVLYFLFWKFLILLLIEL